MSGIESDLAEMKEVKITSGPELLYLTKKEKSYQSIIVNQKKNN